MYLHYIHIFNYISKNYQELLDILDLGTPEFSTGMLPNHRIPLNYVF